MLISLLNNHNYIQAFIFLLSAIFIVFCILPFHEFAHAYTAYKLGDNTAKWQGRLSLNPMRHIDWIGAAMIMFVGFGWAKPVPVNNLRFKNPKGGMAITALAGPVANIIMAFFALLFYNLVIFIGIKTGNFSFNDSNLYYTLSTVSTILLYISYFFDFVAIINIGLAVFNLIPVPPLDGSKILAVLLPDRLYMQFMMYERYISLFLIALLVFTNVLTGPLTTIRTLFYNALDFIAALPFGLQLIK